MRDHGTGKRPSEEKQPAPRPAAPAAPVQRMLALQRTAGNAAVARAVEAERHSHGPGCGHGSTEDTSPEGQRDLLGAAMSTPSRPLPGAFLDRAKSFYRNEGLSAGRVHDNPTAQRATAALGARAMTVGSHIFLGPDAVGDTEVLAHEASHLDKNLRGVRETGTDNGAGVPVTDPRQGSEVSAVEDGAAFEAGVPTAPSVAGRMPPAAGAAGDPGAPVQRAGGKDKGKGVDKGKAKEKSARQIALGLDEEVKQEWDHAYGGGRQGAAPEEVRMRYARSMADDRTSQTLSHQTFLVYDAVQARREATGRTEVNEREVQGMLINNRLLFASNFNESMDLLTPYETDGSADTYPSLVSTHQSDAGRRTGLPTSDGDEYVGRVNRADVKTQAALAGQRDDATARALHKRHGKPVTVVDVTDPRMHTFLTDRQYEGAIFFVRVAAEKKLMHAEQKLLLALRSSGITPEEAKGSPHAVMGRYRGCLCCTAALDYYRNVVGFSTMDYDPNPGFYYFESLENLYRHQEHVVRDPAFRETMLRLARELPSTPALSRTNPPEHAFDNHGPETIEPAGRAARRNYRSPSTSDVEADVDEYGRKRFTSYTRALDVDAASGTGGAKVGKGVRIDERVKGQSRLRAARVIGPEHWAGIQDTWLHGTPDERATVFRRWETEKGASRAELVEIIGEVEHERSGEAVHASVTRSVKGTTGHERRDNRKAGDPVTRRPERGKYAAKPKPQAPKEGRGPAPKEMKRKSRGWDQIHSLMRSERKQSGFYDKWKVEDAKSKPGNLKPAQMSPALAKLVTDLSTKYTVSSMSRRIHIAERTLRRFVAERQPEQTTHPDTESDTASVAAETETATVADDASTVADDTASEYQGGGDAMDYEQHQGYEQYQGYEDYQGYEGYDDGGAMDHTYEAPAASGYTRTLPAHPQQGAAASGSSSQAGPSGSFSHPALSGYTLVTHLGQTLYRDDRSGQLYWRDPDTFRMVPLPDRDSDVEMSDG